jgi:hypothetical protein
MSEFYTPFAENKTREQILKDFKPTTYQDYQRVAILVRATDDIVSVSEKLSTSINKISDSINQNSDTANKLSSRLFWLNVLLTIKTLLGVIFTAASVFNNPN